MAETSRLNPSEILKNYKEYKDAQDIALSSYQKSQENVGGFSGELQKQLGKREISPELKSRERETISSLFGVPTEVRGELSAAGVRPSEVSNIIENRMNSYLDQLESIRDSRKSRQQSIESMVKSVQEGLKSQATTAELSYKVAKDKTDTAWNEYKESIRQTEHAQTTKLLDNINRNEIVSKNSIFNAFMDIKKKTEEKQKAEHGDKYLEVWDGKLDPNEYIKLANQAENLMPGSGKDWFLGQYTIFDNINLGVDYNKQTIEAGGINIKEEASKQSKDVRRSALNDDLGKASAQVDESMFRQIKDLYLLDLVGEGQDIENNRALFKEYLIQTFKDVQGEEIYDKMFSSSIL